MDAGERLRNQAVSDTGFLFDPITGLTFSVNATGRAILDLLRQGRDADGVKAALAERFETGEGDDLDRDAREFLLLLREEGLLPRDGGEP